jgi:hypothetical protein
MKMFGNGSAQFIAAEKAGDEMAFKIFAGAEPSLKINVNPLVIRKLGFLLPNR